MYVPESDYQCPNWNMHTSKIWILLKNYSKKLGYILIKTCNSSILLGLYCFLDF